MGRQRRTTVLLQKLALWKSGTEGRDDALVVVGKRVARAHAGNFFHVNVGGQLGHGRWASVERLLRLLLDHGANLLLLGLVRAEAMTDEKGQCEQNGANLFKGQQKVLCAVLSIYYLKLILGRKPSLDHAAAERRDGVTVLTDGFDVVTPEEWWNKKDEDIKGVLAHKMARTFKRGRGRTGGRTCGK